mmetsp:Transcript_42139/g.88462  ORF Transcript_42139/g.88462 Transcript_42139/m.88462 type:complete len:90 (+) Transcript_42139:42-311(+)
MYPPYELIKKEDHPIISRQYIEAITFQHNLESFCSSSQHQQLFLQKKEKQIWVNNYLSSPLLFQQHASSVCCVSNTSQTRYLIRNINMK